MKKQLVVLIIVVIGLIIALVWTNAEKETSEKALEFTQIHLPGVGNFALGEEIEFCEDYIKFIDNNGRKMAWKGNYLLIDKVVPAKPKPVVPKPKAVPVPDPDKKE